MNGFPGPGTKVGIYARFSSNLQSPKSIDDQIADCRKLAERHRWICVVVESDSEKSGETTVGRHGYRRLIARAEAGEFQVLMSDAQDRLTRNQKDLHELLEILDGCDVKLCTVQDGMVDEVRATINGLQASQSNKSHAHRVRRGQAGQVRRGLVSGSVAYGHKLVRSVEVPAGGRELDPVAAAVVKSIFEDFAAGMSPAAICAKLNAAGIRTTRGFLWRPSVLTGRKAIRGGLLRNAVYKGIVTWGRTSRKRSPRTGKTTINAGQKELQETYYREDLRIVSDELWQAVQDRLETSSEVPLGSRRKPTYLLSGILQCTQCGQSYAMGYKHLYCTGRQLMGVCTNNRGVNRVNLEQAVLDGLQQQLLRPELIEECVREYRAERQRYEADQKSSAAASVASIPQIKTAISNITDQIIAGEGSGFAGEILRQKLEVLGADLRRAERQAAAMEKSQVDDMTEGAIVARLTRTVQDLRNALYQDDREAARARELFRGTIDKVLITPVEGEGDARGAGAVRVEVRGKLAELVELAGVRVGRVVLTPSSTESSQDPTNLRFSFWVKIPFDNIRMILDTLSLEKFLDVSPVPVGNKVIKQAIADGVIQFHAGLTDPYFRSRFRYAMERLEKSGKIRRVAVGKLPAWVSNLLPITDEEWQARHRGDSLFPPLMPTIRLSPPEASVVTFSRGAPG